MQIIQRNFSWEDWDAYWMFIDWKNVISVFDYQEQEDNSLCRDLNFVYNIVNLMKQSYEAGKKWDDFDIIDVNVSDAELIYSLN